MMPWGLLLNPTVLLGLALAGASAFGWFQTVRLGAAQDRIVAVQARFDQFKASVASEGRAAQVQAETQRKADQQRQEKANAQNKATVSLLNQRIASLRYDREHSGSYGVPTPGPAPGSPDRSCFKSTEFERAVSGFVEGAAGLIAECDGIRSALDTAKLWAQESLEW